MTSLPEPHPAIPLNMVALSAFVIFLLVATILAVVWLRRKLAGRAGENAANWKASSPASENPTAFMAASVQGVIEKLRAQERELARLHSLERERAQESERLTEEVTRNMPTGLLLVSATGAISSSNPAAEAALGIPNLRYRSYLEALRPDSELARMLTACLREGQTIQRGEVEFATAAGETRRLGVTISPIVRVVRGLGLPATGQAAEKKVTGALCLMSDLTELARLQQQVRWKENLAALGEMAAGIAHEFKNSLATISGYAQMLRGEAPPGELAENADRILEQTRALTHVVTEFLRFARPLEMAYESVPMRAVVERVAEEVRESEPCEITAAGDFRDVPGDEGLLRQALLNLVRNAAQAAAQNGNGGRVIISGSVEERGGRRWQRVSVADNGRGIPAEAFSKIFLPFYTTKSDGTGLGLPVVHKVMLQHGGSVEAHNLPGGGAEFLLWLPLRQEAAPAPLAPGTAGI